MANILKHWKDPFVQIPNATAQDMELSLEAKGALVTLSSYSENYIFRCDFLQKSWKIGKDKLQRILKELKDKGFLKIVPIYNTDEGRFGGQEWNVSTKPIFLELQSDGKSGRL